MKRHQKALAVRSQSNCGLTGRHADSSLQSARENEARFADLHNRAIINRGHF